MKRFVVAFVTFLLVSVCAFGQIDSIHMQIQDTVLKQGESYGIKTFFKEDVSEAEGLQFFMSFDINYLKFDSISEVALPREVTWNTDLVSTGIIGNIWVAEESYPGKKIAVYYMTAKRDCRIKDVFKVLTVYYKNPNDARYSLIFFPSGEKPLTNEYLPFDNQANSFRIEDNIVKAKIYPSLIRNEGQVLFQSKVQGMASMNIYDLQGNKVAVRNINIKSGENQITVNRDLVTSPGMYFLTIQVGDKQVTGVFQMI